MSKNRSFRNNKREKKPLSMALYTLIVAALVACLAGMFLISQKRYKEFEETRAQIALQETEYVLSVREPESESETEDDVAADADERTGGTESSFTGNSTEKSGRANTSEKDSLTAQNNPSDSDSAQESEADSER